MSPTTPTPHPDSLEAEITHQRAALAEIAGKFYWPSAEYSTPADNLCWYEPPAPNRDFRCVRAFGHRGKCQHVWSPMIRDYSHKTPEKTPERGDAAG